MATVERQIFQIQRAQSSDFSAAGADDAPLPNEVAFVLGLEKSVPVSSVRESLVERFQSVTVSVEAAMEDEEEPDFFVVRFPGMTFSALQGSPFDLSYAIEEMETVSDGVKISSVEPVLETDLFDADFDVPREGEFAAESALKGMCFTPDREKPCENDKYAGLNWVLQNIRADKIEQLYGVTGNGVKIAHIDTGIADHLETANIDVAKGLNLIETSQPGAIDPLTDPDGILNPGHGTATASVIISRKIDKLNPPTVGRIIGVAPNAELFPIRAIRSVIRLTQWNVAKAIRKARKNDAQIITMSLGGIWSWVLYRELRKAVKNNIIVLAAAGNCVREVVWPARFSDCIAVAGSAPPFDGQPEGPWKGSSRNKKKVDISAPGQYVWCASSKLRDGVAVSAGEGTSFSVALTAGVAALWLERFDRDALIKSLTKGETLQDRFRKLVRQTARKSTNLPKSMGAGIVDAEALLASDPFAAASFESASAEDGIDDLFEESMAMVSGQGDAFAAAETPADVKTALAPIALEVQWRELLEEYNLSQSIPRPMPPDSDRLAQVRAENPNLADMIP
jgi:hypothetical protein